MISGRILNIIFSFLLLVAFSGCSSLLYQPSRAVFVDSKTLTAKVTDVEFVSKNGSKLHGWFLKSTTSKSKFVVLHFHGNAQNLTSHILSSAWMAENGLDVFIFDYQGYGRSEGTPSPRKTVEDGLAAFDWVKAHHPKSKIILFGQSLGSAVALRTAIELKDRSAVSGIVIEGGFISYSKAGSSVVRHSGWSWILKPLSYILLSDSWAPGKRIRELSPIPILVIHGENDRIIQKELGEDLYQAASAPKEFWLVPEGKHISTFTYPQIENRKRLIQFIRNLK